MPVPSFMCICLNPTLQKTLQFSSWHRDQVNRTANFFLDASGKGVNVCRVLTQLGKHAVHVTQLGGHFRDLFINLCEKDHIPLVWTESSSEIRFCYTLIDQSDRSVTEIVEESAAVSVGTEERLVALFREQGEPMAEQTSGTPTLIVSGTKAAGFSDAIIPGMVSFAKDHGFRIILDIKGNDLRNCMPYHPDIIKPNLLEFCTTYLPEVDVRKVQVDEQYQASIQRRVIAKALDLAQDFGCSIIISRGANPVWIIDKKDFYEVPLTPVKPVNTTGSGDAFTAGLAAALDNGLFLADAVAEGNRCGALNAALLRPGVIRE